MRYKKVMFMIFFDMRAAGSCCAGCLMFLSVFSTSARALVAPDRPPPESVAIVPELIDPDFSPRLGKYHYRFQWMLRIGADATVSIARYDDAYKISTRVSTGWFVDRIYRVRFKGDALVDAEDFSLINADMREEVRRSEKVSNVEHRDGKLYSERVRTRRGRNPRHQSFEQSTRGGQVTDLFGATLIVRAIPWEVGDLRTLDVFDGRRINRVTMECLGTERVEAFGREHEAFRIHLSIKQGDPEDIEEDDELLTDEVEVFIAADESREVLRIEADTKYGSITVTLDKFEPAGKELGLIVF